MADDGEQRDVSENQQDAIDALNSMADGTFKDDDPVDLGDASPRVRFACDGCGKKLKASPEAVGTEATCPKCKHKTKVPPFLRLRN